MKPAPMTAGDGFRRLDIAAGWDLRLAAARLEQHRPTPMDLEIELQEEVFISNWRPGEQRETEDGYDLLPIETSQLRLKCGWIVDRRACPCAV